MSGIMKSIAPRYIKAKSKTKITVVGTGAVGMASAFSLINSTQELVLIDVDAKRVEGEVLDLQQGQQFMNRCKIYGGTDYSYSKDSTIVVVTAGARQNVGEDRLDLIKRNVNIFRQIIPKIVENSPDCVLVILSNPVDLMTYITKKISDFPSHRVIGSGTMLDSARFRYLLGEKLGVSAASVHGYIIGEHGDSSVPVWSSIAIAGVNLSSINPDIGTENDEECFENIHSQVVSSAYKIIELKGYTSWAIGLSCRALCNAILSNSHTVYPLSTYAKGIHGIEEDVYLSLPCLVTSIGISAIIPQKLNERETEKIRMSAKRLREVLDSVQM